MNNRYMVNHHHACFEEEDSQKRDNLLIASMSHLFCCHTSKIEKRRVWEGVVLVDQTMAWLTVCNYY